MTMHPRLVFASTTTMERFVETTKNNKKNYGDVRTNKSIFQVSMSISSLFSTNKIEWKYRRALGMFQMRETRGEAREKEKAPKRHYTKSILYSYMCAQQTYHKYHDNIDVKYYTTADFVITMLPQQPVPEPPTTISFS